jgi:hypothetical protein
MDSSRELTSIYTIDFVISLYLIFLIDVQTFDTTGLKFSQKTKHTLSYVYELQRVNIPNKNNPRITLNCILLVVIPH